MVEGTTFLRAWCAVAYAFPGLHPDGYEDEGSGWPRALRRFAAEAWRRAGAGELSDEELAVDIEDAIRMNVAAITLQIFVGGEFETRSIHNMTRLVDMGLRYGIPTMAVTAVGKDMVRDAKYFRLACRMAAELGAQIVKTYYVPEDFDTIVASCPVPIVMAGGKKISELEALTMSSRAIEEGASGVDMGRNIFQSDTPLAMMKAVNKVVHEGTSPQDAFDYFNTIKAEG